MSTDSTDRIHDALDGELDPGDLTPHERREFDRTRAAATTAVRHLRRSRSPGLAGPVMQQIETRGERSWVRALWEPRSISIRPFWGLLAAAILAGVILLPSDGPSNGDAFLPDSEGVTVFVQFRLHAPEASQVQLAGSFTDWEPAHDLHPADDGSWAVMVPMEPGIHDYAFVVDGTDWTPDPSAPRVDDGFGGENSRLALLLVNGARES